MGAEKVLVVSLALLLAVPTGTMAQDEARQAPALPQDPLAAWEAQLDPSSPGRVIVDQARELLDLALSRPAADPGPQLLRDLGFQAPPAPRASGSTQAILDATSSAPEAIEAGHPTSAFQAALAGPVPDPGPSPQASMGHAIELAGTQGSASAAPLPAATLPPALVETLEAKLDPATRKPVLEILRLNAALDTVVEDATEGETVDIDRLAQARGRAARQLATPLAQLDASASMATVTVCPFIALDLAGEDSQHTCPVDVSIDMGGDDVYTNDAGGANGDASILVDASGDDTYAPSNWNRATHPSPMAREALSGLTEPAELAVPEEIGARPGNASTVAVNGGAHRGIALFLELGGEDTYEARLDGPGVANGAARQGAALFYEGGGGDTYTAEMASGVANGASWQGHALLYEGDGVDTYQAEIAGMGAANGATLIGAGTLVDEGGDDTYLATIEATGAANGASGNLSLGDTAEQTPAGQLTGELLGPRIWAAPHASASAALIDRAGADTYNATLVTGAANGAAGQGVGTLVDRLGDDAYTASLAWGAAQGAGFTGVGALRDAAGNDTYDATATGTAALQGAGHFGLGLLHDAAGHDTYAATTGPNGSAHGAAVLGAGLLADRGGNNTYDAAGTRASQGAAVGFPVSTASFAREHLPGAPLVSLPASVGLMVTSEANDLYLGTGVTQGSGDRAGIGILLDAGGTNDYIALGEGIAQGTGRHLGVGLLEGHGESGLLFLDEGMEGQGSGLQGVGILSRPFAMLRPSASIGFATRATTADGAGIGIMLDAEQEVVERRFHLDGCENSTQLSPDTETDSAFVVCSPDATTRRRLQDPFTGDGMGDIPKPACDDDAASEDLPSCREAISPLLPPGPVEWLARSNATSTTSGGLVFAAEAGVADGMAPIDDMVEASVATKMILPSFDDSCGAWCFAIEDA